MKILLIVPTDNYTFSYPSFIATNSFPIGFAFLASSLKSAGFEVHGLNLNNRLGFENPFQMLKALLLLSINEIKPDLICTGGLCTDYAFIKDTLALSRQFAPHTPVVLGGGIVTHDAEFVFTHLRPDFCVIGEGEEALVQLAEAIKTGETSGYHKIPNIGFWENSQAVFGPQDFNYPDLDLRPFPDYEPFQIKEMVEKFSFAAGYGINHPRLKPRLMPLIAARSCPFSCTFCVHHQRTIKYRARSLKNIFEEISLLYEKYEFNILYILDELFAAHHSRVREFSETLLSEKKRHGWDFNWTFCTHASASLDRETLQIAKESGCYAFVYGIESASPTVLKSMNKKINPSQIVKAIKLADEVEIGFGGNLIFGDIAESAETINESMSFFNEHCKDICHLGFGHIQPFPGSKLFDYCMENGLIKDKHKYYESIGNVITTMNMTQMPDWLWRLWVSCLKYFMLTMPWLKSTAALSLKRMDELKQNPMVLSMKTDIFEIEAQCPLCGKKTQLSSFLGEPEASNFRFQSRLKRKLMKSHLIPWLFQMLVICLSIGGSFRKMFYHFRYDSRNFFGSIPTICIHCHKKFRVRIAQESMKSPK